MEITGGTRLVGLVGDPVQQARSPALFNRVFSECSVNAVCVPFAVPPDGLAAFFEGAKSTANVDGLLVTTPHKRTIVRLLDDCSPASRVLGAVNAVRREDGNRWVGAMFDGVGCLLALRWNGVEVAGRSVLLAGCGGAGRAIGLAAAQAGAARLSLTDIDAGASAELADLIRAASSECSVDLNHEAGSGYDVVINATTLGMYHQDPSPIDADRLAPDAVAVDLTNEAGQTALGRAALAAGCKVVGGLAVHAGQAVFAARFLGFQYWPVDQPRVPIDDLLRA